MASNDPSIIAKTRNLKYETPFFYTNKEILKSNYSAFVNSIKGCEVYYALKSNSDAGIIKYLNKLGCNFEAASAYEIASLFRLGISAKKILYGTSVKSIKHIKMAKSGKINTFTVDSREEIEKVAKYAPGSNVIIRVRVDDEGSVFHFSERFGAPLQSLTQLILHTKKLNLHAYGISFHVGSQATKVSSWSNAILSVREALINLKKQGITLEALDIGGGFPVKYCNNKRLPAVDKIFSKINFALEKLPYRPKIFLEPGRAIVASATVMVSEVISRTIRNSKIWLVLDGGVYNGLFEAMVHQGSTQYAVHTARKNPANIEKLNYALTGPTGDSLDIITRDILLPYNINVGDKLIFENAGAYTISMSCSFNGFPKPKLYIA